jgi:predicted ATP-grasp superfamily ATP-dependent carboligase
VRVGSFLEAATARPPAVVLQVGYANGLGVIRDLAREGVPVLALDADPRALGLRSRLAAGMLCPAPAPDEEAFVAFLEELGPRLPQRAVVFPTQDEYVWPLSRHAERLERWYRLPFARWPQMSRLHDKRAQLETAWATGVDTPRTVFLDGEADLDRAAEAPYPGVLKPVASLAFKRRFFRPVLDVDGPGDVRRLWPEIADLGTIMLQERVPGGDDELWTVGSYLDHESRALALFTGRKLRQHPRGGGSCRLGEALWNESLAQAAVRLLQALRYWGVSQVEFKRDPRDGRYRLMEVNARHWMWHSLAAASGVNLSFVAYADAIGQPFVAPRQGDGAKWIVASKDLPLALHEVWRGELGPGELARSLAGVRTDGVLSPRDPVPGLVNLWRVGRQIVTRQPSPRVEL